MKSKKQAQRFIKILSGCTALLGSHAAMAQSGTWTADASGNWSDTSNWSGGTVADGSGNTADFSTIDITADRTVTLDTPRTLGNLLFGDTSTSSAAGWLVDGGNTLTLGGTPFITVNALGTGKGVTISDPLAGTVGFTKSGPGSLTLNPSSSSSITGTITVREGTLLLDYTNMATPTNMLPSTGTTITLSPTTTNSKLVIKGNGTTNTSQTLAALNAGTGTSMLLVDPNNAGSVTTTLTLTTMGMGGTRGFNSPRTLIVGVLNPADESKVTINCSSSTVIDNGGVVPGNLLYTNDGGVTVNWATHSPTNGPITRTVTPSNTITDNFTAAATLGATSNQILVKTTTSGQSLDLNGFEIVTGYGILFTGAHDYEIKNGRFNQSTAGTGNQNTRWMANHHYGTGVLTISARLLGGNVATATGGFTKTGPGTTVLSAANTYNNTTFVDGGVLSISSIANGGLQSPPTWTTTSGSNTATVNSATGLQIGMSVNASNIIPYGTTITGISGTTITLSANATSSQSNQASAVGFASGIGVSKNNASNLVLAGGTLKYTGGVASTDRLFEIQANSGLDASGTGALTWSNTGTYTVTNTAGPRTLTLTGTNADDNTLSGLISDQNASTGKTSLTKSGLGKWVLDKANTYTGPTNVTGGTLKLSAIGSIISSASVELSAGATFDTSLTSPFAIPAAQPYTFHLDGTGVGSSGQIAAADLDISNANVTFVVDSALNDAAYVLASYSSLTGASFLSATPPVGYTIDYAYAGGTQIALVSAGGSPEIAVDDAGPSDIPDGGSKGFGNVLVGSNTTQTFTIKNTGTADLTGLTYILSGSTDFSVTVSPTAPVSGPSGTTTFTVQFAPTSTGLKNAHIAIANNDSDENPFDIDLSGTGTAPEIDVEDAGPANIPDGGSKSFGTVLIGGNTTQTFTIKNTGTADLTGLTYILTGSTDFSVTASPTAPVSGPSGTTTFTVQFAPTSTGLINAHIAIANNDSDENPFDIDLSGTGTTAFITWATVTHGLSGGNAAFDFDYDKDGIANGMEWILGGNPTVNDNSSILPAVTGSAAGGLTLVFNRAAASIPETTLTCEWNTDLNSTWNSIPIGVADVGPSGINPTVDIDEPSVGKVTVNIPAGNAVGGRIFARLRATNP